MLVIWGITKTKVICSVARKSHKHKKKYYVNLLEFSTWETRTTGRWCILQRSTLRWRTLLKTQTPIGFSWTMCRGSRSDQIKNERWVKRKVSEKWKPSNLTEKRVMEKAISVKIDLFCINLAADEKRPPNFQGRDFFHGEGVRRHEMGFSLLFYIFIV